MSPWQLLADAVLVLHAGVVLFVVFGLVLVVAGNLRGWAWVNGGWFRAGHLGAIVTVVAQAWLGITCPLTTLENALRARAGLTGYRSSFIEHWVAWALYYEAPPWVFTLVYTLFAALVVAVWWRWPPRRAAGSRSTGQGSR